MKTVDALETSADIGRHPDRTYDGYILDLDGTVYLGDEPLPGARNAIAKLRSRGHRVLFVSNNPTRDPEMYLNKLRRMGIFVEFEEIVNSISALQSWLLAHHAGSKLFVIGEAPLKSALSAAGFELIERANEVDVVVASYDRTFNYNKLQIAFDALWRYRRAILVATNPDRYCPLADGGGEPDAAAVIAAIEACSGVKCSVNVGKPSPLMLDAALARLKLKSSQCLMIGDRLSTDIAMAQAAKMDSAVVLTGETQQSMLEDNELSVRPTWVIPDLSALLS